MNENTKKEKKSTFWEETYFCANKYRCTLAVYLMTILSLILKMSIDRWIFETGHGKYVVKNNGW